MAKYPKKYLSSSLHCKQRGGNMLGLIGQVFGVFSNSSSTSSNNNNSSSENNPQHDSAAMIDSSTVELQQQQRQQQLPQQQNDVMGLASPNESGASTATAAATTTTSTDYSSCPMKVIAPNVAQTDEGRRAVRLLALLDALLQQPTTRLKLEAALKRSKEKSLRRIQGGRIEIFCRARKQNSTVFNQLCDDLHKQISRRQELRRKRRKNRNEANVEEDNNDENDVDDDSDQVFDNYVYRSGRAVKKAILDYAMTQARMGDSERVTESYTFDNFSILVNYDKVKAQVIHLDMQAPNFQFGLLLTDKTVPTQVYQPEFTVRSVADVKNKVWTDMSDSLNHVMATDSQVPDLLVKFGDLLCPTMTPVPLVLPPELQLLQQQVPVPNADTKTDGQVQMPPLQMPTGTLLSLPGSVIHAGPACEAFRAVLFFSAWPGNGNSGSGKDRVERLAGDEENDDNEDDDDDAVLGDNSTVVPEMTATSNDDVAADTTAVTTAVTTVAPYDPDVQYSNPVLICDIAMVLWDAIVDHNDRIFLLGKIVNAMIQSQCKTVFRHLKDPSWIEFAKVIGYGLCPTDTLADFMVAFANDSTAALNGLNRTTHDIQHRTKLSVENLETAWDGESCYVQLYLCHDSSVENGLQNDDAVASSSANEAAAHHDNDDNEYMYAQVDMYYTYDQRWEYGFCLKMPKASCSPSALPSAKSLPYLFDGTNGELRDKEGVVVWCSAPVKRGRGRPAGSAAKKTKAAAAATTVPAAATRTSSRKRARKDDGLHPITENNA